MRMARFMGGRRRLGAYWLMVCCCLSWAAPSLAAQDDGLYWLGRVLTATREQNYSGTFVYRNGLHVETSRITHVVEQGRELERLEVLDGSPREVIRSQDELKCYLPENRTLIIEKRNALQRSSFPVMLPTSLVGLNQYYTISKGRQARVADREAQVILIEPRDELRYGHRFWIDKQSGLLLQAGMLNERGDMVETLVFTQLTTGQAVSQGALQPRFASQSADWRVVNVESSEAPGIDEAWRFRTVLPGFRKLAGLRRTGQGQAGNTHLIYTDGLASISIFIGPLTEKIEPGPSTLGVTNVYKRRLNDHLIVVMGEVPAAALQHFAEGIEAVGK